MIRSYVHCHRKSARRRGNRNSPMTRASTSPATEWEIPRYNRHKISGNPRDTIHSCSSTSGKISARRVHPHCENPSLLKLVRSFSILSFLHHLSSSSLIEFRFFSLLSPLPSLRPKDERDDARQRIDVSSGSMRAKSWRLWGRRERLEGKSTV